MGWKGEGLGKNQDGLKSHVKITNRSTNLGLGTEDTGSNNDRIDAFAGLKSWQRTTSNFSDVLASLNATKSDEVKKMRKHKKKKEKKQKKKRGKEGAEAEDKKTTSGTSFRNVFRKRELKNKDISSMNSKDISLILGTAAPKATTDQKKKKEKQKKKRKEIDMAGEEDATLSPSKKKHKKDKKAKKKKKKKKGES